MGKKQKDDVPNVNSVANRDVIQRLNFMYQASVYLQSLSTGSASTSSTSSSSKVPGSRSELSSTRKPSEGKGKRSIGRKKTANDLARSYVHAMKVVGQKTTVKMDPSIKRSLCKGCDVVLIPGSTALVRVKRSSSHGHSVVYTCTACKTSRRIPAPPTAHMPPPTTPETELQAQMQAQTPAANPLLREILISHEPAQSKAELPTTTDVSATHRKRRKKPTSSRLPPLFARQDAGHVIFRGSERLPEIDREKGHGMFLV